MEGTHGGVLERLGRWGGPALCVCDPRHFTPPGVDTPTVGCSVPFVQQQAHRPSTVQSPAQD